ncbi:maleylpyruvate isomerase family mycothiol-dependent enzyme [Streptomyces mirabilis]|uniref:maleylpyruvate isomerase family mycothiol-dependent enzyme n=1 Tax=Streptomyces mirabilis TaxID=68239 RepID=UPI00365522CF
MNTTTAQSLSWMQDGQAYFLDRLKLNSDEELHGPSRLPGWTGRHLLSHLGHNARALGRLAHWAATGEPTPMYRGPDARAKDIETGAAWTVARLRAFVEDEHSSLADALDRFTGATWEAEVVTAQGRTVPASTIPWLRARELWIHACDLPTGGDFADFPRGFTNALINDALARRATQGIDLSAQLADRAAANDGRLAHGSGAEGSADLARWLTGRGNPEGLRTPSGRALPELPAWL